MPVPSAPTITTVVGGDSQITVTWKPPITDGGSTITNYTLKVYITTTLISSLTVAGSMTTTVVTGLTNNTVYTVSIVATNEIGDSAVSATRRVITATVPGNPKVLSVNAGSQSAVVTWSPPKSNGGFPITGYKIRIVGGSTTQTVTASLTNLNLAQFYTTVTGLTNGTSYLLSVIAVNSQGDSLPSASRSVTPFTVPDAPTGVAATISNGGASVTWYAEGTGGYPIKNYIVKVYPTNTYITVPANARSAVVPALAEGTIYSFTVSATNAAGVGPESAQSNSLNILGMVSPPTNLVLIPSDSQVVASWTAPTYTGGVPINTYTVTCNPGGLTVTVAHPTATATFTDLDNGTPYTFTVIATTDQGDSTPSAISDPVIPTGTPDPPSLVRSRVGNGFMSITWETPQNTAGFPITSYELQVGGSNIPSQPADIYTVANSAIFAGLSNGFNYTYGVKTHTDASGQSAFAPAVTTVRMPVSIPDPPFDVTGIPGLGQVTLTWSVPANTGGIPITSYTIYSAYTSDRLVFTRITSSATLSATVPNLVPNVPYVFYVVATNSVGNSINSANSSPITPTEGSPLANQPTAVYAVIRSGEATVYWTAPTYRGKTAITSYTVTSSPGGFTATTASGTIRNAIVTGLSDGTAYTFTVFATNSAGNSSPSAASRAVKFGSTQPGPPRNVKAVYGPEELTAQWISPSNVGGDWISAYQVNATPVDAGATVSTVVSSIPYKSQSFIAYDGSGGTLSSSDGISWITTASYGGTVGNCQAYNGSNQWLIGGFGPDFIWQSADGLTWNAASNAAFMFDNSNNKPVTCVAWGGSNWVAGIGSNAMSAGATTCLAYSADGLNWNACSNINTILTGVNTVAWSGSNWIAGGAGGHAVSVDGINWNSGNQFFYNMTGLTRILNYWIGVSDSSRGTNVGYSSDASNWNSVNYVGIDNSFQPTGLASYENALGGMFVAVGYSGSNSTSIIYSTEGGTWRAATAPSNVTYTQVAWNGTVFTAGTGDGVSATAYSYDGITWSNAPNTLSTSITNIIAGGANMVQSGTVTGLTNGAAYSVSVQSINGAGLSAPGLATDGYDVAVAVADSVYRNYNGTTNWPSPIHDYGANYMDISSPDFIYLSGGGPIVYKINKTTNEKTVLTTVYGNTQDIVRSSSNKLYIADYNSTNISVYDLTTNTMSVLGSIATSGMTISPGSLALNEATSTLYIGDWQNNGIWSMNISTGTSVNVGGPPNPSGIAIDTSRNIMYITSSGYNRIYVYAIQGNGQLLYVRQIGDGGYAFKDGVYNTAQFANPYGPLIDISANILYVADNANNRIRMIDLNTYMVSTLAGGINASNGSVSGSRGCFVNGPALTARFWAPAGLKRDSSGNMYFIDSGFGNIRSLILMNTVTPATIPNPPTAVTATAFNNYCMISWTPPANTGGHPIITYNTRSNPEAITNQPIMYLGNWQPNQPGYVPGDIVVFYSQAYMRMVPGDSINENFWAGPPLTKWMYVDNSYLSYPIGTQINTCFFPGVMNMTAYSFRVTTTTDVGTSIPSAASAPVTPGNQLSLGLSQLTVPNMSNVQATAVGADGSVYIGDWQNNHIVKLFPNGNFLNNIPGFSGNQIAGMAIDASANLYITTNGYGAFKISPNGTSVSIPQPSNSTGGICIDADGTIYMSSRDRHYISMVLSDLTTTTTLAGSPDNAGFADNTGTDARFNNPGQMVLDGSGNLYVADSSNNRIRMVEIATGIVTTYAGTGVFGRLDGPVATAKFASPYGMVKYSSGALIIATTQGYREISTAGIVRTLPGVNPFNTNNNIMSIYENTLYQATGTPSLNILSYNSRIPSAPTGVQVVGGNGTAVVTCNPSTNNGGARITGYMATSIPYGLFGIGPNTGIIVQNLPNDGTLYRFRVVALNGAGYSAPGTPTTPSTTAEPCAPGPPTNVVVDATIGNNKVAVSWTPSTNPNYIQTQYMAVSNPGQLHGYSGGQNSCIVNGLTDGVTYTFTVYAWNQYGSSIASAPSMSVTPGFSGVFYVNTFTGLPESGFIDGPSSSAKFNNPYQFVIASSGIMYVVDYNNNAIRAIDTSGNVTTLAGGAGAGSANGQGSAAQFNQPTSIAIGGNGNLYVADSANSAIRMVDLSGNVTTVLNTPVQPNYVAVDSSNNIVFTNSTYNSVYSYDSSGNLRYNINSGSRGFADGPSVYALFNNPQGLCIGSDGTAYIADMSNQRIRAIDVTGNVRTIAGNGGQSWQDDFANTGLPYFNNPSRISIDSAGTYLYITDPGNNAIRRYSFATTYVSTVLSANYPLDNKPVGVLGNAATGSLGSGAYSAPDANGNLYAIYGNQINFLDYTLIPDAPTSIITPAAVNASVLVSWIPPVSTGGLPVLSYTAQAIAADLVGYTIYGSATGFPMGNQNRIALAPNGDIYIADYNYHRILIRTVSGKMRILAGKLNQAGYVDGTGMNAMFNQPNGIALDTSGNVFVADSSNYRIRRITPAGVVTTYAGTGVAGYVDGPRLTARFNLLVGLTIAPNGTLYIADQSNASAIRMIPRNGTEVSTFAGGNYANYGYQWLDGTGTAASFSPISGICSDIDSNLYVVEAQCHVVRKITSDAVVTTIAGNRNGGRGWKDGMGLDTLFYYPNGVGVDTSLNVYVADTGSGAVRKITPSGVVTTIVGSPFTNQPLSNYKNVGIIWESATPGQLNGVSDVAVDASGNIYLAVPGHNTLLTMIPSSISNTIASTTTVPSQTSVGVGGLQNGVEYVFNVVATTAAGGSSVSEISSPAIPVAQGPPFGGYVTSIIGGYDYQYSYPFIRSAKAQTANFNNLNGLVVANDGTTYLCDSGAHMIKKIDVSGNVTTLAGSGLQGWLDGPSTVAMFNVPNFIAISSDGTLYVTDSGNHCIRKIDASGNVTTFAGNPPNAGSQDGMNSSFNAPAGIAFDYLDNLYVADSNNNRIRKIDPSGYVTRISGYPDGRSGFADGFADQVIFNSPTDIRANSDGTMFYIVDRNNHRIRSMDLNGYVVTIAGSINVTTGLGGYADGIGIGAMFLYPYTLTPDLSGNLYVNDTNNNKIRMIDLTTTSVTTIISNTNSFQQATGFSGGVTNIYTWGIQGMALSGSDVLFTSITRVLKITAVTLPGPPTAVSAVGANGSAMISWTPPANTGGAPITSYTAIPNPPYTNGYQIDVLAIPGAIQSYQGWYLRHAVYGPNGDIYFCDGNNNLIYRMTPDGKATAIAGLPGPNGFANGTGSNARFANPFSVVVDASGNIYVADHNNFRIRRVTPAGVVTTFAGNGLQGYVDGVGQAASFQQPTSLTMLPDGTIYVFDGSWIRKIETDRTVSFFTSGGSYSFSNANCVITSDISGNLYLSDNPQQRIYMITPTAQVTCIAGNLQATQGFLDGVGTNALFRYPQGIVVDTNGNVFVADVGNWAVRKLTPTNGVYVVTTVVSMTTNTIWNTDYKLQGMAFMSLDPSGNILICDSTDPKGWRLCLMSAATVPIRTLDGSTTSIVDSGLLQDGTTYTYTVVATTGYGSSAASAATGSITSQPTAPGQPQNVVANGSLSRYGMMISWSQPSNTNGLLPVTYTVTSTPDGLTASVLGQTSLIMNNLMIFRQYTFRVVATNSIGSSIPSAPSSSATFGTDIGWLISPYVGLNNSTGGYTDAQGQAARFGNITAMAIGSDGTMYVSDNPNRRVRKIDTSGNVTTLAGSDTYGHQNGSGNEVQFTNLGAIAVSPSGMVYVADRDLSYIRAIDPSGNVSDLSNNGPWNQINTMFCDANGMIYIGCSNNQVYKMDAFGNFAPIPKTNFSNVMSVAVASDGTIYVGDWNNFRICSIDPSGNQKVLAGGVPNLSRDGVGLDAAVLNPFSMALDTSGNLLFTELGPTCRIRKLNLATNAVTTIAGPAIFSINNSQNGFTDGFGLQIRFSGNNTCIAFAPNGKLYVADYTCVRIMTAEIIPGRPTNVKAAIADGTANISWTAPTYSGTRPITGYLATTTPTYLNGYAVSNFLSSNLFNSVYQMAIAPNGNIYIINQGNNTILVRQPNGVIGTLAGDGTAGYADGPGPYAKFSNITGIAVDIYNNIFVSDSNNYRIRRITPAGVVSTFAGSATQGTVDGLGSNASLYQPYGLTVAPDGLIYMMDGSNIRTISSNGRVTTFVEGFSSNPTGICADSNSTVYVADTGQNKIFMITSDGTLTTVAGDGNSQSIDGVGTSASFQSPRGIAVDSSFVLYVSDTYAVRKITPDGTVTTIAGPTSSTIWTDTTSFFSGTIATITADASGSIYVCDYTNGTHISIMKPAVVPLNVTVSNDDARYLTFPGLRTDGTSYAFTVSAVNGLGPSIPSLEVIALAPVTPGVPTAVQADASVALNAVFVRWTAPTVLGGLPITYTVTSSPGAVTATVVEKTGLLMTGLTNYVSYTFTVTASNSVGTSAASAASSVAVAPGSASNWLVSTFAGSSTGGYADSSGSAAAFNDIQNIAVASDGTMYVSDRGNYVVRKVDIFGNATTLAGSSGVSGYQDGPAYQDASGNQAKFGNIQGIAVSYTGYVYVADVDLGYIRAIDPSGNVTTVAGNGSAGFADGQGSSAQFNQPRNMCCDSSGYLYISDYNNNRIRKMDSLGNVTTLPNTNLNYPMGITIALDGTLYIGDSSNNRICSIDSSGNQRTLAGSVTSPYAMNLDTSGNLFFTDTSDNLVRRLNLSTGLVNTIAGNGTGYTDGVGTNAVFTGPYLPVVYSPNGALYLGSASGIREITPVYAPGSPTNVYGVFMDGTIFVSWSAPAFVGDMPITSYTVTSNTGSYSATTDNGNTFYVTISGITADATSYQWSVVATNGVGGSAPSAPVTVVAEELDDTGVPSSPTGVTASFSAGAIEVSWTAPSNTGGSAITSYTVTSNRGVSTSTADGSTTSLTLSGLAFNGPPYVFTVVATNSEGTSDSWIPSAPVTSNEVPDAPTSAYVMEAANGRALVAWTAPASDGGSAITSYTVTSNPGGFTATTADGSTTSALITGLAQNNTAYSFTVVATNANGSSLLSAATATTRAMPITPSAPTSIAADATEMSMEAVVTWTAPAKTGLIPMTYKVISNPGGIVATSSTTSATVTGLDDFVGYTFTVVSMNAAGSSVESASSAVVTPGYITGIPAAPGAPSAVGANGAARVSWIAVSDVSVTSYTVTSNPGYFTATTSNTSCILTGLSQTGVRYTFTVQATNSTGLSAPSAPSNAVSARPAAIGPPSSVAADASVADEALLVSWNPSLLPVDRYQVTSSPGNYTMSVTGNTTALMTGLTNLVPYTFTVAAIDASGNALTPPSAPSVAVAPGYASTGLTVSSFAGSDASGSTDAQGASASFNTIFGMTYSTDGTLYVADSSNNKIRRIDLSGNVTTYAGTGVASTIDNNNGTVVTFNLPTSITCTYDGVLYVGEVNSNRIRRLYPNSAPNEYAGSVNTYIGTGERGFLDSQSGNFGNVKFAEVYGITCDASGTLYVSDTGNSAIRKIIPSRNTPFVTTLAGNGSTGYANGQGASARFNGPAGLCVSMDNTIVYVADENNNRIRAIDMSGNVTTLAGSGVAGFADGYGVEAQFDRPVNVICDTVGNLYVADRFNYRIRKIQISTGLVSTVAGNGSTSFSGGLGTAASFSYPRGMAFVGTNLFIAATNNLLKASPTYKLAGQPTELTATYSSDNIELAWTVPAYTGSTAITDYAVTSNYGVVSNVGSDATSLTITAPDWSGKSYVFTVAAINAEGTSQSSAPSAALVSPLLPTAPTAVTAVGSTGVARVSWTAPSNSDSVTITGYTIKPAAGGYTVNTITLGSTFTSVMHTANDASGNTYICDTGACKIYVIRSDGIVRLFAGSGAVGFANGVGAAAMFHYPNSIAVDSAGNLYVSDAGNNRIRKIVSQGSVGKVSTYAGNGVSAQINGLWNSASFSNLHAITVGLNGTLYVCDDRLIRKVPSNRVVAFVAGGASGAYTNGTGSAANFTSPYGICSDVSGNLYVADTLANTIRMISPSAVVTTIAGNQTAAAGNADGQGGDARFDQPMGVAVDASFNVYVADHLNYAIRKVSASRAVSTLAGPNTNTNMTWNTTGRFTYAAGVSLDGSGNLYVSDNTRVCQVVPTYFPITPTTISGNSTVTSALVTDLLDDGTTYVFTVLASDSSGNSVDSAQSAAVTCLPAVPSTVTGVSADATGISYGATVSWTQLGQPGVTYTAISSPGGFTANVLDMASVIVYGLTDGETYTFTVVSSNTAGSSSASTASNSIVATT